MKTVKIYTVQCYEGQMISETGKTYQLQPWGNNTIDYKGEDDGGHDYILPKAYETAQDNNKMLHIYNGDDVCKLIDYNGSPAIVDANVTHPIKLKKA